MKFCKISFLLLLPIIFAGCDMKTGVDFDREVDFSQFKTFAWDNHLQMPAVNEDSHQFIISSVCDQLLQEGLTQVESNPDLYVLYYGNANEQLQMNATLMGYSCGPGWYWGPYYGGSAMTFSTQAYSFREGTLIVDIYMANEKRLIWRGRATATIHDVPEQNKKLVTQALKKLFNEYPPRKK